MNNFQPLGIKIPKFLEGTLENGIQILYSGPSYLEFLNLMKRDNPNAYNRLLAEVAKRKSPSSEVVRYVDADGNYRSATNVGAGYISGTDPVGLLVVEDVIMNKPLQWAGKGVISGAKRLIKPKISPRTSHLQGEDAVLMFKLYGGVEIPEGSINGELLRKYVQEARIRYGLVGNKNITDEEIASALYKHSLELGKGSAAINTQGEPLLLFRGDTLRYTELKPRISPEELAKASGTMDNSLGNLFLGLLPGTSGTSGSGLERYVAHVRDFRGNKRLIGSGTGSRVVTPNGTKIEEFVNDEIASIPEGSYPLVSYQTRFGENTIYKLPASWTESGVNDINAFVVRTPKVRDASKEISVLNDDFLTLKGSKVNYYGTGFNEREGMAKHYREVLNRALAENLGLLKSNKRSYLRDEHEGYDYFALPNFNIKNVKHLLPYDLRIPRNWNDPNIFRGLTTIIGLKTLYGNK